MYICIYVCMYPSGRARAPPSTAPEGGRPAVHRHDQTVKCQVKTSKVCSFGWNEVLPKREHFIYYTLESLT